ncbi:hypothetical protein GCM10008024_30850 [Allgaiera indica]|uniref:Uncharacterized protein n=1 Tax=Allgaiera indica TaxID=765699 RepID=A0AAN4UTI5_9RHOB|nr:hypothetical protein GCM10008024_30850 [Allgaiera indica]
MSLVSGHAILLERRLREDGVLGNVREDSAGRAARNPALRRRKGDPVAGAAGDADAAGGGFAPCNAGIFPSE